MTLQKWPSFEKTVIILVSLIGLNLSKLKQITNKIELFSV